MRAGSSARWYLTGITGCTGGDQTALTWTSCTG
jgi:hypothetical protein